MTRDFIDVAVTALVALITVLVGLELMGVQRSALVAAETTTVCGGCGPGVFAVWPGLLFSLLFTVVAGVVLKWGVYPPRV